MILRSLTWICAFLIWLGPVQADMPKPESTQQTLEWMAEALRDTPQIADIEINSADQSLEIEWADESKSTAYPDNLHRVLLNATDGQARETEFNFHIQAVLESYILSQADPTHTDLERVFPVIRPADFGSSVDIPKENAPLSAGQLADFKTFYVLDTENSVRYMTEADLAPMNTTRPMVEEQAFKNLDRKFAALNIKGEGLYILELDGFYESSFVLYSPLWEQIDEQLSSIFMIVPARDLVVFMDGPEALASAELQSILDEYYNTVNYPVSNQIFKWHDGQWNPLPK